MRCVCDPIKREQDNLSLMSTLSIEQPIKNSKLQVNRQLNNKLQMCGNQVSSVSNPNADFYNLVTTQIPSKKISIKSYPMTTGHSMQMNTMNLTGIRELSLEKCRLNHQSLQELSHLKLPILTKLCLNDNQIGPLGCRILSSSTLILRLTELSMNNNKIKDVGVKALATADLLAIQDLSLSDNNISVEGLATLQGKLESIQCLNLGGNKLNDRAVAVLNAINPEGIYFLKLSRNELTDEGLKDLLKSYKSLQVLLIDRNKIKEGKDKYQSKNLYLFY